VLLKNRSFVFKNNIYIYIFFGGGKKYLNFNIIEYSIFKIFLFPSNIDEWLASQPYPSQHGHTYVEPRFLAS